MLGRILLHRSTTTGWVLPTLALLSVACEGNHDFLAAEPSGAGGSAGAGGSDGGAGAGADGGSPNGGMGQGGGVVEPEGSLRITVANGVVDQPAVQLCFIPYPQGGGSIDPWPSGGMPFGRAATVEDPAAVAPPGVDVFVHAVGGDLGAVAGASCDELTSGAAPLGVSVAPLALIPAAVFEANKSLLLVPAGCMGGDGHEDEQQEQACGAGYSLESPNPTIVGVSMSRIQNPGRVGFQVVQASAAASIFDVYLTRGFPGSTDTLLGPLLSFGAILPYPPFAAYTAADLGPVAEVMLTTFLENSAVPTSEISLGDVLTNSGLAADDVGGGQGHVLVAVGAAPGAPSGSWWHDFGYVLIPVDP